MTLDAMGGQKTIAKQIHEAGGDSVLALKDNHPTLCEEVERWLNTETSPGRLPQHETVEKDHGRIEIRRYRLGDEIDWLESRHEWAGLQALGRVESIRIIGDPTTTEFRYFLCSHTNWLRLATEVRGHWGIENGQHGVLDVQFGEDAHRARKDYSATHLGQIRRMALNVIQPNDPAAQESLRRRKRRAMLNDDYRSRLIFGDQMPQSS